MLVEQPGGLCVRSKVSKGERGRRGGQGGDAVGRAWPCGPREDFREVGALQGCGQRGVGCSPAPSGGFFGEDPPGPGTGTRDRMEAAGEVRSGWSRTLKGCVHSPAR